MTKMNAQRRISARAAGLMCGASAALLSLAAPAAASAADAAAPAANQVEEVIVTGSSIRGAPPVGSDLIAIGQQDIQRTAATSIQQVLRSVPAVVGMGAVGQGGFGSADNAGTNAPTIHGLGASASNSTLILIDGHRFPLAGINHALGDPNILAPMMIERVEVLAEGASSVYGSDAVAGVINFISRRHFDGVEVRAQTGFADDYRTYALGAVAGKTWEGGNVIAGFGYSDRDGLLAGKRDFTRANHISQGGSNLGSFACAPATIQVGSGPIFTSPYTGAGVANAAVNAPCDYTGLADLIPSEKRYNGMIKVYQDVTDRFSVSADALYSNTHDVNRLSRGTIQATVFGPGAANASQINPFFVGLPGGTATSESVRFDADELFGPGAQRVGVEETGYVHAQGVYKLDDNWQVTASGIWGLTNASTDQTGVLNASAATLALNGTTNGAGSLTAVSVPATGLIVTGLPLTKGNALDVFHTGSANLTSAATRARLIDSQTTFRARHTIQDGTLKIDGSLFNLPAGPVKVAAGAEYIKYTLEQNVTQPNGTGPATTGSAFLHLDYDRTVKSAYVEALVPLIGPEMNVPLMRRVDVSVSGRYDDYSDFGSTSNPRVAGNWEIIEGLKLRANYAKSFVAPALTSRGADANGTTAETAITAFAGTINVPVAAYPNIVGLPGCVAGAVTCTLGSGTQGLQINGGNAGLQPQKGDSWSVGGDWDPGFVPHLRLSATYWHTKIAGGITAPQAALAVNAAGLNNLLTIYPASGATAAQIAAVTAGRPLQTTIPANVSFVYNFTQTNALNLWVEGVDLSANYGFDTDVGHFGLEGIASYLTKFDQQVGTGGAKFSVLGSTGFNTTFPSIKLSARAGVTWESKFGLSANLFWNHTGEYRNWSGTTVTPLVRNAAGVPTGGGDKVDANNTFDLHAAYDFSGDGWSKDLQLFVDVNNLTDKTPPFYNTAVGYDTFSGNPIGRLTTIGVRKKW